MARANLTLIRKCCNEVKSLGGDAAEVGVLNGESAEVIADELGCDLWLFDTFEGFPERMVTAADNHHKAGQLKGDLQQVRSRMEKYGERVRICPGIFPDTALSDASLKFVHIDVDLYESTKAALQWAMKHTVHGGVILCDDYGFGTCLDAKQAIDELLPLRTELRTELIGQRLVIRRL